jgi:hypothetical protein
MKIAFCTTCRGRAMHVRRTLPQNIADNPGRDSVFVLLDYNSQDDLEMFVSLELNEELERGKLVYYRNPEPVRFRMAHAKNQAHRCGLLEGADVLVNLDADNLTGWGFAAFVRETFERIPRRSSCGLG